MPLRDHQEETFIKCVKELTPTTLMIQIEILILISRPSVAGAALQTTLSFSHLLTESSRSSWQELLFSSVELVEVIVPN